MLKLKFNMAGYVCLYGKDWALHIGVKQDYWIYGRTELWYDGPYYCFGYGAFFLLVWDTFQLEEN